MNTATQIELRLQENLTRLKNDFAVAEIGIFGSYCRGEQTPQSDLDILVHFTKPVGFVTFMQLENYLQELLGVKVDLVTRAALKPHIGAKILQEVKYVH